MGWLRKNIIILAALLIVYSTYFVSHQKDYANQKVLGMATSLSLFTQPEDGRQPILDAINSAQKEIDVEIYMFSDKEIINSIEGAENRGVHVRVLLEKHPFGAGSINQKTFTDLQQHHIDVVWTQDVFPLTHEKMILIDEKEVLILNQNLTATSFEKNREFDVVDTNTQDIEAIQNQFVADWNKSPFSFASTHLLLSPINSRAILEGIILQAQKSLFIEMEVLDDRRMTELLLEKAKTIHIQIIFPSLTKVSSNKKVAKQLADSGISVKFLDNPYPHAKLILADSTKAYIGSVNLTSQSMDENRELGIIVSQEDVVVSVDKFFFQDWEKAL